MLHKDDAFSKQSARIVSLILSSIDSLTKRKPLSPSAIALTGSWGTGKTHFIQNVLINEAKKEYPSHVFMYIPVISIKKERDIGVEILSGMVSHWQKHRRPISKIISLKKYIPMRSANINMFSAALPKGLKESLSNAPKSPSLLHAAKKTCLGDKKLIILLDDIDRLDSDVATEVLKFIQAIGYQSNDFTFLITYPEQLFSEKDNDKGMANVGVSLKDKVIAKSYPVPKIEIVDYNDFFDTELLSKKQELKLNSLLEHVGNIREFRLLVSNVISLAGEMVSIESGVDTEAFLTDVIDFLISVKKEKTNPGTNSGCERISKAISQKFLTDETAKEIKYGSTVTSIKPLVYNYVHPESTTMLKLAFSYPKVKRCEFEDMLRYALDTLTENCNGWLNELILSFKILEVTHYDMSRMDIEHVVSEWLKRANQKPLLSMSTEPFNDEDFMSRANERIKISTPLAQKIGPMITRYIDQEKDLFIKRITMKEDVLVLGWNKSICNILAHEEAFITEKVAQQLLSHLITMVLDGGISKSMEKIRESWTLDDYNMLEGHLSQYCKVADVTPLIEALNIHVSSKGLDALELDFCCHFKDIVTQKNNNH
ncbi:MAG: hypothetical protein GY774_23715 [Planctomycetes bacterium]|nr:hypothetical protein [Planctomycetota bacterium]